MTDMSTIEIISHCWNGPLSIYAPLLRAQGRSFIDFSDHVCDVVWSVCYHESDKLVVGVLDSLEDDLLYRNVRINRVPLPFDLLFQRAIGRNKVALESTADCVWFCDCDYLFAACCLDDAIVCSRAYPNSILYPSTTKATSHEEGDALIKKMEENLSPLERSDMELFYSRPEEKAIGGIRIVKGNLARSRGYLNGTKWVQPVKDTAKGFRVTRCDVKYRSFIGSCVPVYLRWPFRIRHSKRALGGFVVR